MSNILILNAGTASPITVVVQSAGENAPTEIGSVTPSFQGADRSSVRAVKRNYGSLTTFVTTAVKDSIIDLLKSGHQLPCSGDLLANIQKQCTVRYTGATMSPSLVDFWTVGLTLSEVQPNNILLRYSPGDTITGESFTRSTAAYYRGTVGLGLAGINVKRDANFVGGVGTQSTLLEGAAINSLLQANDFSNAAWTKTTITVTTGIADPVGGTTACTLTATGASAEVHQYLANGASLVRANSIWLRRRTGTGTITLFAPDSSASLVCVLTASWQRFSKSDAANVLRHFDLVISTNADAIDVWCGQLEDGPFATSEIPTTTVAVTRGADNYSLPLTTPPGETTIYAKLVEQGSSSGTTGGAVFDITSAASAAPDFVAYSPSAGLYRSRHRNAATTVTSDLGAGPAFGDTVELCARLFGDGSTDITQSINGAVSTAGTQSAANALATAWSGLLVWLNSAGTAGSYGFTALQSFKVASGMRSLAEMRAL